MITSGTKSEFGKGYLSNIRKILLKILDLNGRNIIRLLSLYINLSCKNFFFKIKFSINFF
jgi:hypothetical protein